MKILIATTKSWNIANAHKFIENSDHTCRLVCDNKLLTEELLEEFNPELVFFPHWSWIIPAAIWQRYECIVFHMTDLPYGRGGSPLQNLIIRGKKTTKICAIRVMEDIDSGPIYLKTDLDLSGSATEIYRAASDKIFNTLIPTILSSRPVPVAQVGEVVNFTRRKPEESNIAELECIQQVYDYIRMLDAEGYPNAFVQLGNIRYEFSNGSIDGSEVRAEVRIKKVKVSQ